MTPPGRVRSFVRSIFSPSHRRAARQRRKDYATHFAQLQEENEARVRRMSQLRGDHDPEAFLYDSAYGTGAFSASARNLQRLPTGNSTARTRPESAYYTSDFNLDAFDAAVPPRVSRVETGVSRGGPSLLSSSSSTTTPSLAGSFDSASILPGVVTAQPGPPTYEAVARRPRPVSMPAGSLRMDPRGNYAYGDFVQVVGEEDGEREVRLTAFAV